MIELTDFYKFLIDIEERILNAMRVAIKNKHKDFTVVAYTHEKSEDIAMQTVLNYMDVMEGVTLITSYKVDANIRSKKYTITSKIVEVEEADK